MAKKFVRGITDIKTINNQDFDTNNVNDLLSDGEHNYIHRKKKDNSEEYHNLTNNLKTVTSDNTDLLEVTNDNETSNSATLHPKHDIQKEQSIESTRNTITIEHAENATSETTKVDTNPAKVLEHSNLLTGYGISKTKSGNTTTVALEYTRVNNGYDLNNLTNGHVRASYFTNAPSENTWFFVSAYTEQQFTIQHAVKLLDSKNVSYKRLKYNNVWGEWREQVGDKSVIDTLLSNKQNTLQNNASIGVAGTGLRQLYVFKETYSVSDGALKTHVKSVSENTSVSTAEEEFNFIVKLNKGVSSVNFTLNEHDTTKFSNIMTTYGENNSLCISGCVFTLSGSTLTVSTANNTEQNYVITFSDII
ncbi:MAG: hypothetical protein U0K25_03575 [Streptococcus sp.]|nr:hypothetical protein [Streptococcus sp.]